MATTAEHPREKERLDELYSLSILDTLPEESYDNLTAIAAEICGTPISLVSLVDRDRQWFKSQCGVQNTEMPRELSMCAHTILQKDSFMMVEDARLDERFTKLAFVNQDPPVIFYAGVQLRSSNNLPLGTLCVLDHKPRKLAEGQVKALKALASQVEKLFELKQKNNNLKIFSQKLNSKNKELERFAYLTAHDLKSPLNQISGLISYFHSVYQETMDEDAREILNLIKSSASSLGSLVDGLLEYSLSDSLLDKDKSRFDILPFLQELTAPFTFNKDCEIALNSSVKEVYLNSEALKRILINLISNAIKHRDKETVQIQLSCDENDTHYLFSVSDNGPGIDEANQERIFRLFEVMERGRDTKPKGHGIGLAMVKKLVEHMGGNIRLHSGPGKGAKFVFEVRK